MNVSVNPYLSAVQMTLSVSVPTAEDDPFTFGNLLFCNLFSLSLQVNRIKKDYLYH